MPARFLLVALTLLGGCAPLATRQTTEPAAKGHFQGSVGVDGILFRDTHGASTTPSGMLGLGARYGVSEDVDVGLRLYTLGVEASMKWRIVNGRVSIAVAPGVAIAVTPESALTTKATYVYAELPAIVGTRLTESASLNLGPKLLWGMYRPYSGGAAHGLLVGGFVNLDARVGRGVHVLPELGFYGTAAGEVPVRGVTGQLGCGVLKDF